jgi:hypothetical protein
MIKASILSVVLVLMFNIIWLTVFRKEYENHILLHTKDVNAYLLYAINTLGIYNVITLIYLGLK